jgi:hypothetical protein
MPLGIPGKAKRLAACSLHLPSQETCPEQSTAGFLRRTERSPWTSRSAPTGDDPVPDVPLLNLTLPASLDEASSCKVKLFVLVVLG